MGTAAVGALAEKPELFGRLLIFIGLAEGIAIYGLIVSILDAQPARRMRRRSTWATRSVPRLPARRRAACARRRPAKAPRPWRRRAPRRRWSCLSAAVAAGIGERQLRAALAALSPLVLIVPDLLAQSRRLPDLAARLQAQLGLEA